MQTLSYYKERLSNYKQMNASRYGISKLGIFGSVARGEQKDGSDVDVCISMEHPKLFYMVHIKDDLQQLFGCPVDIIRLRDNMDTMLRENINRDTVYV